MDEIDKFYAEQKLKKSLYHKKWYEKNRVKIIEKSKAHYELNKEQITKKGNEIIQCPLCHCMLKKKSLSHHKQTKKCEILKLSNSNV